MTVARKPASGLLPRKAYGNSRLASANRRVTHRPVAKAGSSGVAGCPEMSRAGEDNHSNGEIDMPIQHKRPPRQQPAPPARKAPSVPPAAYTPPAGLPAGPKELLAHLKAGLFTDEQLRYLHGPAFQQYVDAINTARSNPELAEAVLIGDQIIAAWAVVRVETTAPLAGNPFAG